MYALRVRASLFGFNAPHPKTLSNEVLGHYIQAGDIQAADKDWPFAISEINKLIDLDTTYPGILRDSWLVLSSPHYLQVYRAKTVIEASRSDFTLATKTTRLTLDTDEHLKDFEGAYRDTMVFAQSELLEMAEAPITTPITGATIPLAQAPSGLVKGKWLAASGKDSVTGNAISEMVQVSAVNGTMLTVTPPLKKSYVRDGFSLNANVAHATDGETVSEILGSGDASQRYQRFTLRQPPLTYVSAATPSGAASTLEVRVNDLLWHEKPTLFARGSPGAYLRHANQR